MPDYNPTISSTNNQFSEGQGYSYDDAGNLTNEPGHTYKYDAENRLIKFDEGTDRATTNVYDGDGRRVKKIRVVGSSAESTIFVYDASGNLISEYAPNTAGLKSGTKYLTQDRFGSTRVVTDGSKVVTASTAANAVMARYDYLPFGELLAETASHRSQVRGYSTSDNTRQKFTQKERDNEMGLDYFLSRYYSSAQGRFLSVDPDNAGPRLNDPQSWNGYTYARNNPLLYTDPDGLLYRIIHQDGTEEILTDEQFDQLKNNPYNGDLGVVIKGGTIYNQDDNGNLVAVATYERIWFDDLFKSKHTRLAQRGSF